MSRLLVTVAFLSVAVFGIALFSALKNLIDIALIMARYFFRQRRNDLALRPVFCKRSAHNLSGNIALPGTWRLLWRGK